MRIAVGHRDVPLKMLLTLQVQRLADSLQQVVGGVLPLPWGTPGPPTLEQPSYPVTMALRAKRAEAMLSRRPALGRLLAPYPRVFEF